MTTQVRFHKRIKLFPGLYLNFGKRGFMSVTIGPKWVSVNIGRGGWYLNGSLPGTGLRARKRLDKSSHKPVDNSDLNELLLEAKKVVDEPVKETK